MRYRKENGQWKEVTPIGASKEEVQELVQEISETKQDLTHNYYTKTEVDAKVPKWGTMQELGDITTSTQITATKNGFLKVFINPSTINGAQARFAVAGSSYSVITLNGEGCYAVAPCNAGDVITCSILTGASNIRIYQIPFI